MLALFQGSNQIDGARGLRRIVILEAALDLTLVDNIKVVSLVSLMEHILARIHLHHLQPINELQLVVLVKSLE